MVLYRRFAGPLLAVTFGALSTIAMAEPAPKTRLVSCGEESCLLIAGQRENSKSVVSVNGHPVIAEGGRAWQALLSLEEVRAWSVPYARSVAVTVVQPDGITESDSAASLPIGLLGHVPNLATLIVTAR